MLSLNGLFNSPNKKSCMGENEARLFARTLTINEVAAAVGGSPLPLLHHFNWLQKCPNALTLKCVRQQRG